MMHSEHHAAEVSAVSRFLLMPLCFLPAGYFAFPTTVSSNVLNSFPADDTVIQVSTCLTAQHVHC
jgi:hypothetical protein